MEKQYGGFVLDVRVNGSSGLEIELDKKRALLEEEVATFKAQKEEEFKAYERELRERLESRRSKSKGKADPDTAERGLAGPLNSHPHGFSDYRILVNGSQTRDSVQGGSKGKSSPRVSVIDIEYTNANESEKSGARSQQSKHAVTPPANGRDVELKELFKDGYLPLLDGPRRYHSRDSKTSSSPPNNNSASSSIRSAESRNNNSQLSSSATLPATTYEPLRFPAHNGPFSASVPRPTPLQERRSSSRGSDVSITSLRSSLKQAKTPRSPKHVLFSIDNIVLSPSTSPIAQRKGANPPILFSGLTDMPAVSEQVVDDDLSDDALTIGGGKVQHRETVDPMALPKTAPIRRPSTPTITSPRSPFRPPAALSQSISAVVDSQPILARPYKNLVEPIRSMETVRSQGFKIGGDDFEDLGSNDDVLFSFDEDVRLQDDEDRFEDDDESDEKGEGEAGGSSVTSASPHAGSLPIEIKWPPRKDPRKS
ncbi:MAG: hypothetical protein MMC33_002643 [Icmadophila ericetorum]|nr:hypothetical protein [Icmadophila ericetorum]